MMDMMSIKFTQDNTGINMKLDGVILKQVESYQYLGQLVTEDGRCEKEIRRGLDIAKKTFSR